MGLFLSGGIDSSLVLSLLAKNGIDIKTFTIGFFEKDYNEVLYAKKIASYFHVKNIEYYLSYKEAFNLMFDLPIIYDEPFADSSCIPTYFVSKIAREHVKIVLSADGGDEQFCGYHRYLKIYKRLKKIRKKPFIYQTFSNFLQFINEDIAFIFYKKILAKFRRYRYFLDTFRKNKEIMKVFSTIEHYDLSRRFFFPNEVKSLLKIDSIIRQTFKIESLPLDEISFMMYYDIKIYLPDNILVKVDRASMANALEAREPLLDHKIFEFSSQLPVELKCKKETTKYILKKILCKFIPRELLERKKMGFRTPIIYWLRKTLFKDLCYQYLNYNRLLKEGIFNAVYVQQILDDFF